MTRLPAEPGANIPDDRLLYLVGPVIAAGVTTASLALLAGLFGWQREFMLSAAGFAGAAALLLSIAVVVRLSIERKVARHALANVQAQVGSIIESAMDAIVTIDEGQRVVLVNESAERMFGWDRDEMLGQPIDLLIPERYRNAHRGHVAHFGRTGMTSRRMGDKTVLSGLRKSGQEFPIEASISHLTEDGQELYTVILRDITARLQAEQALHQSREELRELAAVSHNAREQEKSRIARELHDELAQALTALKMDVSWLAEKLPADDKLQAKLHSMQDLLDDTVTATRRISADLRPLLLDDLGFAPAVEWLASNFSQRTGIPCEFAASAPDIDLPDPQATAVFRMLQECLTNIARHARATQVEINLERGDGEIAVSIQDNGCGFDIDAPRKSTSFGLLGLRERANLLDGRVMISSAPETGTLVDIRVPMRQSSTEKNA